jgi:prepilin-type processing-associated H-X9-DG protein
MGMDAWGWGDGWAGQVYPYIKNMQIFRCPDDSSNSVVSYAINADLVIYNNYPNAPSAEPLAAMTSPATTVQLSEVANNYFATIGWYTAELVSQGADYGSPGGNGFYAVGICTPNNWTCQYATGYPQNATLPYSAAEFVGTTGRHSNGANYVCCDGHAKWLQPGAVSAGGNNYASWGLPLCGYPDGSGGANAVLQANLGTCHDAVSYGIN